MINNSNKKYMKIKFNLDNDLPLNKTLELRNMTIIVRAVFFFMKTTHITLDESLYKF